MYGFEIIQSDAETSDREEIKYNMQQKKSV